MSVTRVTNDNIVSFEGSKMIGTIGAECMPAVLPAVSAINLTNLPALGDLGYQNITNWQDGAVQTISLNLNADAISKVLVKVWQEYPDNDKTNGDWDITTNDSGFDLTSSAYAQTLTPAAITGSSVTFTMGGGTFAATDLGKVIMNMSAGETGQARIISIAANVATCKITTDFTNTDAIASGDWTMFAGEFTSGSFAISNATVAGGFSGTPYQSPEAIQSQNCWSIMLTDTHGIIIYMNNGVGQSQCRSFGIDANSVVTFSSGYINLGSAGEHYLNNMSVERIDNTRCLYSKAATGSPNWWNNKTTYFQVITSTSGSATPVLENAGSSNTITNFYSGMRLKRRSTTADSPSVWFSAVYNNSTAQYYYDNECASIRVWDDNFISIYTGPNNIYTAHAAVQDWQYDVMEFNTGGPGHQAGRSQIWTILGTGSNGQARIVQLDTHQHSQTLGSEISLGSFQPNTEDGLVQVSDTLAFLIATDAVLHAAGDQRLYYVPIYSNGTYGSSGSATDITVGTPVMIIDNLFFYNKLRVVYDGVNIHLNGGASGMTAPDTQPTSWDDYGSRLVTFDVDIANKSLSHKSTRSADHLMSTASTSNLRLSTFPTATDKLLFSHYGSSSEPGFTISLEDQSYKHDIFPQRSSNENPYHGSGSSFNYNSNSRCKSGVASFSGGEFMTAYIRNNDKLYVTPRYMTSTFNDGYDTGSEVEALGDYNWSWREVACTGVSATKAILIACDGDGRMFGTAVTTSNTQTKDSTLTLPATMESFAGIGNSSPGLAICKVTEDLAFYAYAENNIGDCFVGLVKIDNNVSTGLHNHIHDDVNSDSRLRWTYSGHAGGHSYHSSVAALSSSKLLVSGVNTNGNIRTQAFSYAPGGTYNVNTGEMVNGLHVLGNVVVVDSRSGGKDNTTVRVDDTTAMVVNNVQSGGAHGQVTILDCSGDTPVVGATTTFASNLNPIQIQVNMFSPSEGVIHWIDGESPSNTVEEMFYAPVTIAGGVPTVGPEQSVYPGKKVRIISSEMNDDGLITFFHSNIDNGYPNGAPMNSRFQKLSAPLYVANQYVTAITGTDSIDTTNYADLNSMTVTETLNGGTANYAFAIDSTPTASTVTGGTFFVIGLGETTTRNIASSLSSVHGGVDGTWYINNDATYGSTTWVAAATNEAKEAIAEATAVTNNQMSGTTVNAVTDTSWPALGTQLSVAITLHSASDSSSPSVDGISLNYDGNVINRDMTESYTVEMLNNSSVRITAPSSGGPRNARVYITS